MRRRACRKRVADCTGGADAMSEHVVEAAAIIERVASVGGTARALGGIGIALRCPSAAAGGRLNRTYGDLDLATDRKSVAKVTDVITASGYAPASRFNAAHGRSRLLFYAADGRHLDVFIDTFTMCHGLDLRPRLGLHTHTLPLADLLLTKLQIAQLNKKDVVDIAALIVDHDLATRRNGHQPAVHSATSCVAIGAGGERSRKTWRRWPRPAWTWT